MGEYAMQFPYLLRSHIAQLLDVRDKTVSDYIEQSKPGGRYAGDPTPEPVGYLDAAAPQGWVRSQDRRPGLRPVWALDSRQQWLDWRERHPARNRRHDSPADNATGGDTGIASSHMTS